MLYEDGVPFEHTALLSDGSHPAALGTEDDVDPGAEMVMTRRITLTAEFSAELIALSVRRGSSICEILSYFGHHWASNVAEDWSWERSKAVLRLHSFLSHSWRASGRLKTLALLCHFNFRAAYICSISTALIVGILVYAGILPNTGEVQTVLCGERLHTHVSFLPAAFGFIAFLLIFCFWQRVRYMLELIGFLSPQYAFLDKLAINQHDKALKLQGIESLCAFINASDEFCILWSPDYFTRLWCTFEVAALRHLTLNFEASTKIVFLPLQAYKYYLSLFLFSFILATAQIVLTSSVGNTSLVALPEFLLLFSSIPIAIAVNFIREHHHHIAAMEKQFAEFAVQNTECFDENDRVKVEDTITAWLDPDTLDRTAALSKFDAFVRDDLFKLMTELTHKRKLLSYWLCMGVSLPLLLADTMINIGNSTFSFETYATFMVCQALIGDVVGVPLGIALVCASVHFFEERCMPTDTPAGIVRKVCVIVLEYVLALCAFYLCWGGFPLISYGVSEIGCWVCTLGIILLTYLLFNVCACPD